MIRYFLIVAVVSFSYVYVHGQSCPLNIDFEEGNFTNWNCFIGKTFENNGKNVIRLDTSKPLNNRHEIVSADSNGLIPLDEYGGFPKVCPYGGKYSVKLGNTDVGAEAEGMSYTFTVPATEDTFTITYFYAVVFENPHHSPPEQPRFFVTAYETATGNPINCASYNYVSEGGIPGFKTSKKGSDVLYKEWSPVSIQFVNLGNKQVTLEFKTADCTQGGHFGYAYFDVGSGCSNILATAPYCRETNSLLLNAPYGFQSYTWYNEDYSQILGTDQNLTLSPPPVTNGKFWVDLMPYPGYGCRDTAYALVTPLPVPDTPSVKASYFFCQNEKASSFSGTPALNCYLLWYTDTTKPGSTEAIVPSTATPGVFTYYVSQKFLFGCESFRKKITVQVDPVPVTSFTLNTYTACEKDNFFTCISTSTNLQSPSYLWDFGNGDTLSMRDSVSYVYPTFGNYTISLKITNGPVCNRIATQKVKVVPKPVAAFNYPATVCQNQTAVTIADQSFVPDHLSQITQWQWMINGTANTSQKPPPFIPADAGNMPVSLTVTTTEGCTSDTLNKIIKVHLQPYAQFTLDNPVCENKIIRFTDQSYFAATTDEVINAWHWNMDGTGVTQQSPSYHYTAGLHHTSLTVQSNYGCNSIEADSLVEVFDKPVTALSISDSCVYRKIVYTATDYAHNVSNWYWDFGSGAKQDKPVITKYFSTDGGNNFTLFAATAHGCRDTIYRAFKIYMNRAFAGHDTLVAYNQPVQLNANGGSDNHYTWSPATGLNDAHAEAPVATLYYDQQYRLDAITNEGCDAHSTILIKRYNGPDIYIPTAFTPNNDRLNDVLRAFPVGMKKLGYFAVFNKFGQRVFYTEDFSTGWDGNINSMPAKSDTYIAVAQATEYTGKPVLKKVTVVLMR
ncbi:MAG: gliding motility-associated C-terminal domain-containing protein [Parafilimonas sp.]|nr:gliding motility-associated C-terminal domain-containing protein [Parafilimonas sp.]